MEQLELIYLAYFAGLSVFLGTTIPLIVEAWMRFFNPQTKRWKSIWSWVVPIMVGVAGWALGVVFQGGFMYGYEWYYAVIFGGYGALMANVSWKTVPWLKEIVEKLFDALINMLKGKDEEKKKEPGTADS